MKLLTSRRAATSARSLGICSQNEGPRITSHSLGTATRAAAQEEDGSNTKVASISPGRVSTHCAPSFATGIKAMAHVALPYHFSQERLECSEFCAALNNKAESLDWKNLTRYEGECLLRRSSQHCWRQASSGTQHRVCFSLWLGGSVSFLFLRVNVLIRQNYSQAEIEIC